MLLLFALINSLEDSDESREEYSRAKFIQVCTVSLCVELWESQASPRTEPHLPAAATPLGAGAQLSGFNQAFVFLMAGSLATPPQGGTEDPALADALDAVSDRHAVCRKGNRALQLRTCCLLWVLTPAS